MMQTYLMLRALARGVNPETGEFLNHTSLVHSPETIRMLFALADEFYAEPERMKKVKLSSAERRQKNISEGRPANFNFPWSEGDRQLLEQGYTNGKTIEALSVEFERSARSIAVQLEKMELITEEQAVAYN